jgi:ECF transporter S component (folate family)
MGNRTDLERIVFAAILVSIAIVIKIIFQYIPLPNQIKRIDLFLAFIILGGILLGPLYGALIGFCVDSVYMMIFGGDLLFAIPHLLAGLIPGLVFHFLRYRIPTFIFTLIVTVAIYFTITTYLLDFYGYVIASKITIYPRVARTLIALPIYFTIIELITRNSGVAQFSIMRNFRKKHKIESTF